VSPNERKVLAYLVEKYSDYEGGCTLLELKPDSCRWPLGDPSTPEFRFCGANRECPTPYCSAHADLAYNIRKDKRRHLVATAFDAPRAAA
jgi:GcrA cell cycle regulator